MIRAVIRATWEICLFSFAPRVVVAPTVITGKPFATCSSHFPVEWEAVTCEMLTWRGLSLALKIHIENKHNFWDWFGISWHKYAVCHPALDTSDWSRRANCIAYIIEAPGVIVAYRLWVWGTISMPGPTLLIFSNGSLWYSNLQAINTPFEGVEKIVDLLCMCSP